MEKNAPFAMTGIGTTNVAGRPQFDIAALVPAVHSQPSGAPSARTTSWSLSSATPPSSDGPYTGSAPAAGACFGLLLAIFAGAVRDCLTTCGLLRRNGARPREMADSRVLATACCIHIQRRVAVLRDSSHFRGFRSAGGGEASRAWHPREFGAVLGGSASHTSSDRLRRLGLRPRVIPRSLRRRSRRLRGDTRRNASSPGYRLLALRRVSPRIRRTAAAHVAQFGTRPLVPCLTFP